MRFKTKLRIQLKIQLKIQRTLLLLLCGFVYGLTSGYATAAIPERTSTQAIQTSLIFESSLQQNKTAIPTVTSITQDQRGFIWLGTINGLVRFDGYAYKTYRTGDTGKNGLMNDWVSAVHVDAQQRLWLGTKAGIQGFDLQSERFTNYAPPSSKLNPTGQFSIGQIISDQRDNLWITSYSGLLYFDTALGKFTLFQHRSDDPNSISSDRVYALLLDQNGNLWVGTDHGLDFLPKGSTQFEHLKFSDTLTGRPVQKSLLVWALGLDANSRLWLGLPNGLAYFSVDEQQKSYAELRISLQRLSRQEIRLESDAVMKILPSKNGDLWVASRNSGLFRKKKNESYFSNYQRNESDSYSLCDNEVFALFEDRSSVLWVGTWNGGACHTDLANSGFRRIVEKREGFTGLNSLGVRSLIEDQDGDLIAATIDGYLNILNKKTALIQAVRYIDNAADKNRVQAIVADRQGKPWYISPEGIRSYNKQQQRFDPYLTTFTHLPVRQIFCAMIDRDGDFWITTEYGVFVYATVSRQFQHLRHQAGQPNSLENDFVYPIVQDHDGIIWMGTPTGLQRYDKEKKAFSFYAHDAKNPHSIVNGNITALFVDPDGSLWIGSNYHLSRLRFDNKGQANFKAYTTIALVDAILAGNDGKLWISTDSGISSFDKNTERFWNYFENDGITKGIFRSEVSFASRDGSLYFGGPNGITQLDPSAIRGNLFPPETAITGFQFLNRAENTPLAPELQAQLDHLSAKEMRLNYDLSSFTIEFAALHFSRPSANQFSYRLQGFDQDWRTTDAANRTATYTNLNPGLYVFHLKAASKDQVWSADEVKLQIRILPPFWQLWWVKWLVIIASVYVVWRLHSLRINQLLQKKRMLELEVAARTQVISQQNKDKSKFIADAAHDLRQPMQAIGNLLDATASALKASEHQRAIDLVQLALKATHIMRSSFNAILELSRLETGLVSPKYETLDIHKLLEDIVSTLQSTAETHNVEIRLIASRQKKLFIHSDKNLVFRILTNLIANAIKYSDDAKLKKYVVIRCVSRSTDVAVYVIDNGIGIPAAEQDKIFKAFFQINNAGKDRDRGMGLGLSIVAAMLQILKQHHMHFRSALHIGTRFSLSFPRASENNQAMADMQEELACRHPDIAGIFMVYVEDDALVRVSTVSLLRGEGLLCSAFVSHAEMMAGIADFERIPDMVLTDHVLADQHNSADVITDIRAFFEVRIPAIILTGETLEIAPTSQALADIILHKPVSAYELLQAIESLRPKMISNSQTE
ncbi:hybrid sensor histidine kinase/response regulator [Undibacterium flavidum]|uniref:histidine kinase n=1 Tax=Undibacterium flavidum TaxID=2762297 RepID=A0ABR6YBQ0_9BURK|nr:hybrid sensor histidine kinase/response regulator [Undibacterium flavidum]MBC3874068.1 hypothetical protein [Undibacterium flavidum]